MPSHFNWTLPRPAGRVISHVRAGKWPWLTLRYYVGMLCDWGISLKTFFQYSWHPGPVSNLEFPVYEAGVIRPVSWRFFLISCSLNVHVWHPAVFSNVNQNNFFCSIGTTLWIKKFLFVYNSCFVLFTKAISRQNNYKYIKQINLISHAWLQAYVALQLRSTVFWDVTQRRAVISWPLKMGPIGCFETSVRNCHSYLLIPWSRVLFEKLTGSQIVKKCPAFNGTWKFITAFTTACHMSISWAR